MKMNDQCLPCLVNQIIKVAEITHVQNKETLYKKVFQYLSTMDFQQTNPEIIGETFRILKEFSQNEDPYKEIRNYYNHLFMGLVNEYDEKIMKSQNSFLTAMKYAILANIIDFNPMHNHKIENIMQTLDRIEHFSLEIDDVNELKEDITKAQSLLYLGDNCGEICFDKLLLKQIQLLNPNLQIYFGVRGKPVVNDSIEVDAYEVGIDEYATIISNGDYSLGTIIKRTSSKFQEVYKKADVVICKGQANYESLSDEQKNIYFLLMVKCQVIAKMIDVPQQSMVCLHHRK